MALRIVDLFLMATKNLAILWTFAVVFFPTSAYSQNSALVIIDMQEGFEDQKYTKLRKPWNRQKYEATIERIKELVVIAIQNRTPILVVEFEGLKSTHTEILKTIGDYSNFKTVLKNSEGMFDYSTIGRENFESEIGITDPHLESPFYTRTVIENFLKERNVTHLLLTGLNGGACVACSASGAIDFGYKVVSDPWGTIDLGTRDTNFIYPYDLNRLFFLRKLFNRTYPLFIAKSHQESEEVLANRIPERMLGNPSFLSNGPSLKCDSSILLPRRTWLQNLIAKQKFN